MIEILIVVAILGIIAAIALPSYENSAREGRRSDGQSTLLDAASKMEAFFFSNRNYTTDLTDLGYPIATGVNTPERHYTIGVSAPTTVCPITSCYELQAIAVGAQIGDGNLTIDSLGRKMPADKW